MGNIYKKKILSKYYLSIFKRKNNPLSQTVKQGIHVHCINREISILVFFFFLKIHFHVTVALYLLFRRISLKEICIQTKLFFSKFKYFFEITRKGIRCFDYYFILYIKYSLNIACSIKFLVCKYFLIPMPNNI